MRENDIVFFNIHRRYLDHMPNFDGFLGIYLLAAFVNENGYLGQAYAGSLYRGMELLNELCTQQKTAMIGLYCDYANVTENQFVSRYIKERYGIPVIVGGPQATSLDEAFFKEALCDAVVYHEGELTVLELMDFLLDGTGRLADIKGIAYWQNDEVKTTTPRPVIENLDALPFVDEDCYLLPQKNRRDLCIMTGRGCPFRCAFCYEGRSSGKVRFRSVENVLEEIDRFLEEVPRGVEPYILFTDDTFTLDEKRVHRLCEGLKERQEKRHFHWFCEGHVHTLKLHPDMIKDIAAAGALRIQLGIESGVPRVLEAYRKHTTPEEIKEVIAACREAGIKQIYGNIILGSAFFSRETYEQDLAFGKELLDWGQGTLELGVVCYWPLPETSITKEPEKYGIQIVDYDFYTSAEDFPQTETEEMSRWEILRLAQHMEKEFAAKRKEMLLEGRVPLEQILSWYPRENTAKAYGLWYQTLQQMPNLYAYGRMLAVREGMTGREAKSYGRTARPMRVLSLQRYLQFFEGGRCSIEGTILSDLEMQILILSTGRTNCQWIYEHLKAKNMLHCYEEMQAALERLEKAYLIVYSRESVFNRSL